MKVFVVVCHDRNCDDGIITAHSTREGADREVDDFKSIYTGHEWTERDYGKSSGWVRYVDSYDDGPNARIQEMVLQP